MQGRGPSQKNHKQAGCDVKQVRSSAQAYLELVDTSMSINAVGRCLGPVGVLMNVSQTAAKARSEAVDNKKVAGVRPRTLKVASVVWKLLVGLGLELGMVKAHEPFGMAKAHELLGMAKPHEPLGMAKAHEPLGMVKAHEPCRPSPLLALEQKLVVSEILLAGAPAL
mmetsp:Transcript_75353/g.142221  ORF Transcript_75353/g.142221 Transcript_75353/m.142221 type:complete len:167 (-) Transcript_75353:207-707(-)